MENLEYCGQCGHPAGICDCNRKDNLPTANQRSCGHFMSQICDCVRLSIAGAQESRGISAQSPITSEMQHVFEIGSNVAQIFLQHEKEYNVVIPFDC